MIRTVVKPVPHRNREHLLLQQVLEELLALRADLAQMRMNMRMDWDAFPTESIVSYKPSFVRGLRRSLKQLDRKRTKEVASMRDI